MKYINHFLLMLITLVLLSCGESNELTTQVLSLENQQSSEMLHLSELKKRGVFAFEGTDPDTGDVCGLVVFSYQYEGAESIENLVLHSKTSYLFHLEEGQDPTGFYNYEAMETKPLYYYDDFTFSTLQSAERSITLRLAVAEKIDSASSFSLHWFHNDHIHRKQCDSLQFIPL